MNPLEEVRETLVRIAGRLEADDSAAVVMAASTIERLATERDQAQAEAARWEKRYVELEARFVGTSNA